MMLAAAHMPTTAAHIMPASTYKPGATPPATNMLPLVKPRSPEELSVTDVCSEDLHSHYNHNIQGDNNNDTGVDAVTVNNKQFLSRPLFGRSMGLRKLVSTRRLSLDNHSSHARRRLSLEHNNEDEIDNNNKCNDQESPSPVPHHHRVPRRPSLSFRSHFSNAASTTSTTSASTSSTPTSLILVQRAIHSVCQQELELRKHAKVHHDRAKARHINGNHVGTVLSLRKVHALQHKQTQLLASLGQLRQLQDQAQAAESARAALQQSEDEDGSFAVEDHQSRGGNTTLGSISSGSYHNPFRAPSYAKRRSSLDSSAHTVQLQQQQQIHVALESILRQVNEPPTSPPAPVPTDEELILELQSHIRPAEQHAPKEKEANSVSGTTQKSQASTATTKTSRHQASSKASRGSLAHPSPARSRTSTSSSKATSASVHTTDSSITQNSSSTATSTSRPRKSRPTSPVRRPASPTRRPASPVRRPVSPTRRPVSPTRRSNKPNLISLPTRNHNSKQHYPLRAVHRRSAALSAATSTTAASSFQSTLLTI